MEKLGHRKWEAGKYSICSYVVCGLCKHFVSIDG